MQQFIADVCNKAVDYPMYVWTGKPKETYHKLSETEFYEIIKKVCLIATLVGIASTILPIPTTFSIGASLFYPAVHELRKKDPSYQDTNYASNFLKQMSDYVNPPGNKLGKV